MSIVRKNTEERLVKYLNTLQQRKIGKALFVPASSSTMKHELDLPVMVQLLRKVANEQQVVAFEFENGDLMVIVLTIRCSLSAVTTIIATYAGVQEKEAINIFDLERDWVKVIDIAEKKFDQHHFMIAEEKRQQEEKARQEYHDMIMASEVSPELVSTIAERRLEREEICVLVVEDDLFSRTLVYKSLNQDFYVETAADGKEAIAKYAIKAPDIIFLDIDLPDITGHEVLYKVMEMDSQAFVVMLSGNSDKGNVLKSIHEGAKGFVGKPFSRDKLLAYVQDAVSERLT